MPPQIPYGSASRAYWRHCVITGHTSQTDFALASCLARRDPAAGKKIDGSIPRHDPRSRQSHAEVEGSGSVLAALAR
jgi:hypothetical protein